MLIFYIVLKNSTLVKKMFLYFSSILSCPFFEIPRTEQIVETLALLHFFNFLFRVHCLVIFFIILKSMTLGDTFPFNESNSFGYSRGVFQSYPSLNIYHKTYSYVHTHHFLPCYLNKHHIKENINN